MKLNISMPMERLIFFKKKLGLEDKEMKRLNPYRNFFVSKKDDFSAFFHRYFLEIPETRIILEYKKERNRLPMKIWPRWFESLFKKELDEGLMAFLWRSGLVHVEEKIDQRFINLGYAVVRQFCQKTAEEGIPSGDLNPVMRSIDKIIDFCVLAK